MVKLTPRYKLFWVRYLELHPNGEDPRSKNASVFLRKRDKAGDESAVLFKIRAASSEVTSIRKSKVWEWFFRSLHL